MSYNKLFFNSVEVVKAKDGGVSVQPNFLCPRCGEMKSPESRPQCKLSSTSLNTVKDKECDKNSLETFTMPCCGTEIKLYMAIHQAKDGSVSNCVSTEPIQADWYKTEVSGTEI